MSQQIELYRKLNFHKLGSPTVGGTITCTATGAKILIGSQPGESTATVIDGYGVSMADDYSAGKYSFGTSYRLYALEINADTGSVDMTGDVNAGAIKGRFVIGTTQTNLGASGIVGTLDVTSGKDLVSSQNGVCGVVDFYGATTISGSDSHVSALTGVVWNEGTTTINASATSSVSGLDLVQNSGSPTTTAGINPAIYIRGTAWQYGMYIGATSVGTTAIYYAPTLTGATARNFGIYLAPTDTATQSTGNWRAIYVNWTSSGTKTGGSIRGFATDFTISGTAGATIYPIWVNMTFTSNPAMSTTSVSAIGCNMGDVGNNCGNVMAFDIGRTVTNQAASRDCFLRLRNYGTAAAKTLFLFEGGTTVATQLFTFYNGVSPLAGAATGSIVSSLKVMVQNAGTDTTQYYIPLYTSVS